MIVHSCPDEQIILERLEKTRKFSAFRLYWNSTEKRIQQISRFLLPVRDCERESTQSGAACFDATSMVPPAPRDRHGTKVMVNVRRRPRIR